VEPARDFAQLQLQFVDQIQWRYELIRPLVLFAEGTPTQRAEDTHTHPDTVRTFLRRFRQEGMLGLLPTDIEVAPRPRASRVPEAVRQEIARLKALHNDFQYREIVRIIFYKCGYRLHPKTAKRLWQQSQPAIQEELALGDYHSQGDRYQARVQVIKLYYQGWTKRSISRVCHVSRPTIDGCGCSIPCAPEMPLPQVLRGLCFGPRERGWSTRSSPPGECSKGDRHESVSRMANAAPSMAASCAEKGPGEASFGITALCAADADGPCGVGGGRDASQRPRPRRPLPLFQRGPGVARPPVSLRAR
jgi:hypothetical protein